MERQINNNVEGYLFHDEIGEYYIPASSEAEAVDKYNSIKYSEANPLLSYKELRQQTYLTELGDWGNQLDMIYWDTANGTTVWRDKIAKIKARYPKC